MKARQKNIEELIAALIMVLVLGRELWTVWSTFGSQRKSYYGCKTSFRDLDCKLQDLYARLQNLDTQVLDPPASSSLVSNGGSSTSPNNIISPPNPSSSHPPP